MSKPTIIDAEHARDPYIVIDNRTNIRSTEYVRGACSKGVTDHELRVACGKSEPTVAGLPRVARWPITAGSGLLEQIEAFQIAADTGD